MNETTGQKLIDDLPYVFDLLFNIKSRCVLIKDLTLALDKANTILELIQEQCTELTDMEDLVIQAQLGDLKKFITP